MRSKLTLILVIATTATLGCGNLLDGDGRDGALSPSDDLVQTDGDEPGMVCEYPPMLSGAHFSADLRDCVKIEGGDIGEVLTLDVNGETVIIGDWLNKEGEGEYVGFEVDGDVIVVVKAGQDLFETGEGEWTHPAGTEGPGAKGISFVAFCEPPTDEPVCTPTDGGGGGDPGDGDGGSGDPGDGDAQCDPYTCEPGGSPTGFGDDGSGGDGSTSGGDSSGSGSDGGSATCALATCTSSSGCGSNQGCFEGCCLDVIL